MEMLAERQRFIRRFVEGRERVAEMVYELLRGGVE